MKVQSIKTYTSAVVQKFNHNNSSNHKNQVSFGFGEDYGDDSFLYDSDHSSGGNILEYIGLALFLPFAIIKDHLEHRSVPDLELGDVDGLDSLDDMDFESEDDKAKD